MPYYIRGHAIVVGVVIGYLQYVIQRNVTNMRWLRAIDGYKTFVVIMVVSGWIVIADSKNTESWREEPVGEPVVELGADWRFFGGEMGESVVSTYYEGTFRRYDQEAKENYYFVNFQKK